MLHTSCSSCSYFLTRRVEAPPGGGVIWLCGKLRGDANVAALRDGPGKELDDGHESLSRVDLMLRGRAHR